MPYDHDNTLSDWKIRAEQFQQEIKKAIIGLEQSIRLVTVSIFSRGHILLEGGVGVGKTTLLRAVAKGIGGAFERIEGTIDLMPNDLIYHTYINQDGNPRVDPGPILRHQEKLSTFFFNEVNRARPQVHSLLLRIMAEGSVTAFNREYYFPNMQVFADRNRVEKEETFEIPSAARDRFQMEIRIETPSDPQFRKTLMFDPRFHDVEQLIDDVKPGILPYRRLNQIAKLIQGEIQASDTLKDYALTLWDATCRPGVYGVSLDGINIDQLVLAGASARGMSLLMRAARVIAWLEGRTAVLPEDIQSCFYQATAHRIFFTPTYEIRRSLIIDEFMEAVMRKISAP